VSSNSNYSVYASADYDLTRSSRYSLDCASTKQIDYTFDNFNTNPTSTQRGEPRRNAVTGKGGIEYKWTPDIMTFAHVSTGYKGHAYDLVSTFNARVGWTQCPCRTRRQELRGGLKSSLFERRVYSITVPHRLPRLSDVGDINFPDGTF